MHGVDALGDEVPRRRVCSTSVGQADLGERAQRLQAFDAADPKLVAPKLRTVRLNEQEQPTAFGQLVGSLRGLRGLDLYSTQHRQVGTRSPNSTAKTTPAMIGLGGLLVDFKRHRRNPSP